MRPSPRSPALELVLLAGLAAMPWLPPLWAPIPGLLALVAWLRTVDVRREWRAGALLFGAALALFGAAALATVLERRASTPGAVELAAAHGAWIQELAADARSAAVDLAPGGPGAESPRAAFSILERRNGDSHGDRTFFLIDADDQAVAWSGRGLLHDLGIERLPERGVAFRQSATSATILAVEPLTAPRGWRAVAGESRSRTGPAPLAREAGTQIEGGRWYLAGRTFDSSPELRWSQPPRAARAYPTERLRLAAGLILALGFLVQAAFRAAGRALLTGTVVHRRHSAASILALAAVAPTLAGAALGAAPRPIAALAAAAALAGAGWWLGRYGRGHWAVLGAAAAVGPLVVWGARVLRESSPSLHAELSGSIDAVVLRLALVLAVFGVLAAGGAAGSRPRSDRAAWIGALLALLAAALADLPLLSLPLLAAAGVAIALSVRRDGLAKSAPIGTLVLLAAMLAGGSWVAGDRLAAGARAQRWASYLLPPSAATLEELESRTAAHFAVAGLDRVLPAGVELSETGDLAFALWRDSPLARLDTVSALTFESAEGSRSSFSYGLPLDGLGSVDLSPQRWVDLREATWPEHRIEGEATLESGDGGRWTLRWWLVPRLGFRLDAAVATDLASGLLRGGAALERPFGFPSGARWAAWDSSGALVDSSWDERTPSLAGLPSGTNVSAPAASPDGPGRVSVRRASAGTAAVYLPRLSPGAALERAGTVAAGALMALGLLAALALVAALPRSAVRDLGRRALRSYSKRLLIVYAGLLLLPVAMLYLFLSRTLERRIEGEQELAARAALRTVQRVLGEYVLTLEPGFGIGTAIDDPLLEWLSRVAQHEVNLYWGSDVYASSKRDLFTAGLLPRRLPGEVQERLALAGDELARRTSRAGEAEYLELYAPLEVPGQPNREARLVLSMPLLAQQEEALALAARLRRRALLATLALFLLLAATGTRLARRFTRPIEEIVAGTRRIAGGAPELGFRPEEAELEALAEAIDRMAQKIAQGRERLLAEKELVERIVESVAAGVVALDADGRVLMANRAARELLGVQPGDLLAERLAERSELAPVAAFAAGADGRPAQMAFKLGGAEVERDWTAVRVPLPEAGDASSLLVVEDVSEVSRAQRLDAWAAMARIIAHEIKNPLTPIRLSTEHLREAWVRDREHFESVFERCTDNILRQVEELRAIASEFSTYSQIPRIDRQAGDLVAAVAAVVEAYGAAPPPGVEIGFSADPAELPARFDPRLLPRAVRNLIENAVRASAGRGTVEVRVERRGAEAAIRVADRGPGVPQELVARVLEPYFSTHAAGTGLGLPIAARIAEEHGGSLVARNRPTGGFEVVVTMPLE